MTFKNPAMNFIQLAATIGNLQQLASLVNPTNGNARWNLLQDWLAKNPDKKEMIETIASLPPNEALVYLLNQIDLDPDLLRRYDPNGQITKQAEIAISELQKLYNERKEFDRLERKPIGSGRKKRKQKSMKNAFEIMTPLDMETIN